MSPHGTIGALRGDSLGYEMADDVRGRTSAAEAASLHVALRAPADIDRARATFAELSWLGRSVDGAPEPEWRRVAADLALPVRDGSGPAVRKAAFIDVGPVQGARDRLRVPIAWCSASLTPLFPVFAGHLTITPSELALDGRYAPPLGRVGLLLDQGLLRFVATRTANAFLARVARQNREPFPDGDGH